MNFDPDAFLGQADAPLDTAGFDPDAFLAKPEVASTQPQGSMEHPLEYENPDWQVRTHELADTNPMKDSKSLMERITGHPYKAATPLPPAEAASRTFVRAFDTDIAPAVGTMVGGLVTGTAAGVAAAPSGPGAVAAAIAGDVAGGIAAGSAVRLAQDKAMDAINGDGWAEQNRRQIVANAEAHPVAAKFGALVPMLFSLLGGGAGAAVKHEGVEIGRSLTGAGSKALKTAAEANKDAALLGIKGVAQAKTPLIERVAELGSMGARVSASESFQKKYVEDETNPDGTPISVLNDMARGAVTMGAVGVIPEAQLLKETKFLPAAVELVKRAFGRGTADAVAMTTAGAIYDTATTGKLPDWGAIQTETRGSIPAFIAQNLVMGVLHGRASILQAKEMKSQPDFFMPGASSPKPGDSHNTVGEFGLKEMSVMNPKDYDWWKRQNFVDSADSPLGTAQQLHRNDLGIQVARARGDTELETRLTQQLQNTRVPEWDLAKMKELRPESTPEDVELLNSKIGHFNDLLSATKERLGISDPAPAALEDPAVTAFHEAANANTQAAGLHLTSAALKVQEATPLPRNPRETPGVAEQAKGVSLEGNRIDTPTPDGPGLLHAAFGPAPEGSAYKEEVDHNRFKLAPAKGDPSKNVLHDGRTPTRAIHDPVTGLFSDVGAPGNEAIAIAYNGGQDMVGKQRYIRRGPVEDVKIPESSTTPPKEDNSDEIPMSHPPLASTQDSSQQTNGQKETKGHQVANAEGQGRENVLTPPDASAPQGAEAVAISTSKSNEQNPQGQSGPEVQPSSQVPVPSVPAGEAAQPDPQPAGVIPEAPLAPQAKAETPVISREDTLKAIKLEEGKMKRALPGSPAQTAAIKEKERLTKTLSPTLPGGTTLSTPANPSKPGSSGWSEPEITLASRIIVRKSNLRTLPTLDTDKTMPVPHQVGDVIVGHDATGKPVSVHIVSMTVPEGDGMRHILEKVPLNAADGGVRAISEKLPAYEPHPSQVKMTVGMLDHARKTGDFSKADKTEQANFSTLVRSAFNSIAGNEFTAQHVQFTTAGDDMQTHFDERGRPTHITVNVPALWKLLSSRAAGIPTRSTLAHQHVASSFVNLVTQMSYHEAGHWVMGEAIHPEEAIKIGTTMIELGSPKVISIIRSRLMANGSFGAGTLSGMSDTQIHDLMQGKQVDFDGTSHQMTPAELRIEKYALAHEWTVKAVEILNTGNSVSSQRRALENEANAYAKDAQGNPVDPGKARTLIDRLVALANRAMEALKRFFDLHFALGHLPPEMTAMVFRLRDLMDQGGFKAPDVTGVRERFFKQARDTAARVDHLSRNDWDSRELKEELAGAVHQIQVKRGDLAFRPVVYDGNGRLAPNSDLSPAERDQLHLTLDALNSPARVNSTLEGMKWAQALRLVLEGLNGGKPLSRRDMTALADGRLEYINGTKVGDTFDPARGDGRFDPLSGPLNASLERSLEVAAHQPLESLLASLNHALDSAGDSRVVPNIPTLMAQAGESRLAPHLQAILGEHYPEFSAMSVKANATVEALRDMHSFGSRLNYMMTGGPRPKSLWDAREDTFRNINATLADQGRTLSPEVLSQAFTDTLHRASGSDAQYQQQVNTLGRQLERARAASWALLGVTPGTKAIDDDGQIYEGQQKSGAMVSNLLVLGRATTHNVIEAYKQGDLAASHEVMRFGGFPMPTRTDDHGVRTLVPVKAIQMPSTAPAKDALGNPVWPSYNDLIADGSLAQVIGALHGEVSALAGIAENRTDAALSLSEGSTPAGLGNSIIAPPLAHLLATTKGLELKPGNPASRVDHLVLEAARALDAMLASTQPDGIHDNYDRTKAAYDSLAPGLHLADAYKADRAALAKNPKALTYQYYELANLAKAYNALQRSSLRQLKQENPARVSDEAELSLNPDERPALDFKALADTSFLVQHARKSYEALNARREKAARENGLIEEGERFDEILSSLRLTSPQQGLDQYQWLQKQKRIKTLEIDQKESAGFRESETVQRSLSDQGSNPLDTESRIEADDLTDRDTENALQEERDHLSRMERWRTEQLLGMHGGNASMALHIAGHPEFRGNPAKLDQWILGMLEKFRDEEIGRGTIADSQGNTLDHHLDDLIAANPESEAMLENLRVNGGSLSEAGSAEILTRDDGEKFEASPASLAQALSALIPNLRVLQGKADWSMMQDPGNPPADFLTASDGSPVLAFYTRSHGDLEPHVLRQVMAKMIHWNHVHGGVDTPSVLRNTIGHIRHLGDYDIASSMEATIRQLSFSGSDGAARALTPAEERDIATSAAHWTSHLQDAVGNEWLKIAHEVDVADFFHPEKSGALLDSVTPAQAAKVLAVALTHNVAKKIQGLSMVFHDADAHASPARKALYGDFMGSVSLMDDNSAIAADMFNELPSHLKVEDDLGRDFSKPSRNSLGTMREAFDEAVPDAPGDPGALDSYIPVTHVGFERANALLHDAMLRLTPRFLAPEPATRLSPEDDQLADAPWNTVPRVRATLKPAPAGLPLHAAPASKTLTSYEARQLLATVDPMLLTNAVRAAGGDGQLSIPALIRLTNAQADQLRGMTLVNNDGSDQAKRLIGHLGALTLTNASDNNYDLFNRERDKYGALSAALQLGASVDPPLPGSDGPIRVILRADMQALHQAAKDRDFVRYMADDTGTMDDIFEVVQAKRNQEVAESAALVKSFTDRAITRIGNARRSQSAIDRLKAAKPALLEASSPEEFQDRLREASFINLDNTSSSRWIDRFFHERADVAHGLASAALDRHAAASGPFSEVGASAVSGLAKGPFAQEMLEVWNRHSDQIRNWKASLSPALSSLAVAETRQGDAVDQVNADAYREALNTLVVDYNGVVGQVARQINRGIDGAVQPREFLLPEPNTDRFEHEAARGRLSSRMGAFSKLVDNLKSNKFLNALHVQASINDTLGSLNRGTRDEPDSRDLSGLSRDGRVGIPREALEPMRDILTGPGSRESKESRLSALFAEHLFPVEEQMQDAYDMIHTTMQDALAKAADAITGGDEAISGITGLGQQLAQGSGLDDVTAHRLTVEAIRDVLEGRESYDRARAEEMLRQRMKVEQENVRALSSIAASRADGFHVLDIAGNPEQALRVRRVLMAYGRIHNQAYRRIMAGSNATPDYDDVLEARRQADDDLATGTTVTLRDGLNYEVVGNILEPENAYRDVVDELRSRNADLSPRTINVAISRLAFHPFVPESGSSVSAQDQARETQAVHLKNQIQSLLKTIGEGQVKGRDVSSQRSRLLDASIALHELESGAPVVLRDQESEGAWSPAATGDLEALGQRLDQEAENLRQRNIKDIEASIESLREGLKGKPSAADLLPYMTEAGDDSAVAAGLRREALRSKLEQRKQDLEWLGSDQYRDSMRALPFGNLFTLGAPMPTPAAKAARDATIDTLVTATSGSLLHGIAPTSASHELRGHMLKQFREQLGFVSDVLAHPSPGASWGSRALPDGTMSPPVYQQAQDALAALRAAPGDPVEVAAFMKAATELAGQVTADNSLGRLASGYLPKYSPATRELGWRKPGNWVWQRLAGLDARLISIFAGDGAAVETARAIFDDNLHAGTFAGARLKQHALTQLGEAYKKHISGDAKGLKKAGNQARQWLGTDDRWGHASMGYLAAAVRSHLMARRSDPQKKAQQLLDKFEAWNDTLVAAAYQPSLPSGSKVADILAMPKDAALKKWHWLTNTSYKALRERQAFQDARAFFEPHLVAIVNGADHVVEITNMQAALSSQSRNYGKAIREIFTDYQDARADSMVMNGQDPATLKRSSVVPFHVAETEDGPLLTLSGPSSAAASLTRLIEQVTMAPGVALFREVVGTPAVEAHGSTPASQAIPARLGDTAARNGGKTYKAGDIAKSLSILGEDFLAKREANSMPRNRLAALMHASTFYLAMKALISAAQPLVQTLPQAFTYAHMRKGVTANSNFWGLATHHLASRTMDAASRHIPGASSLAARGSFSRSIRGFSRQWSPMTHARKLEGEDLHLDSITGSGPSILRPGVSGLTRMAKTAMAVPGALVKGNLAFGQAMLGLSMSESESILGDAIFADASWKGVNRERSGIGLPPVRLDQFLRDPEGSGMSHSVAMSAHREVEMSLPPSDSATKGSILHSSGSAPGEMMRGMFTTFASHVLTMSTNTTAHVRVALHARDAAGNKDTETRRDARRVATSLTTQKLLFRTMRWKLMAWAATLAAGALLGWDDDKKKKALLALHGMEDGGDFETKKHNAMFWLSHMQGADRPMGFKETVGGTGQGTFQDSKLAIDKQQARLGILKELATQIPLSTASLLSTTAGEGLLDAFMKHAVLPLFDSARVPQYHPAGVALDTPLGDGKGADSSSGVERFVYETTHAYQDHIAERSAMFGAGGEALGAISTITNAKPGKINAGSLVDLVMSTIPGLPREEGARLLKQAQHGMGSRMWDGQWRKER